MANYEESFQFMMRNEDAKLSGVISDEPNGGKARFGINSVAHPEALSAGFYTMSRDDAFAYAAEFYKHAFWAPINGYAILNQLVANKYFDLAVNVGIHQATLIIQRAINATLPVDRLVVADGKLGPRTLDAMNLVDSAELLSNIKDYGRRFYSELVADKPHLQPYLHTWLSRIAV